MESTRPASTLRPRKVTGRRGFAFAAQTEWNNLPPDVRSQHSVASFKTKLKTYLFRLAYPPTVITLPWQPQPGYDYAMVTGLSVFGFKCIRGWESSILRSINTSLFVIYLYTKIFIKYTYLLISHIYCNIYNNLVYDCNTSWVF